MWRGNKPPPERGFLALGLPIGHDEYVRTQARERLREAREFLQAVPRLPDLQCAWLLLLFCASPRAQYLLRNVPPEFAADYARSHDDIRSGAPSSRFWAAWILGTPPVTSMPGHRVLAGALGGPGPVRCRAPCPGGLLGSPCASFAEAKRAMRPLALFERPRLQCPTSARARPAGRWPSAIPAHALPGFLPVVAGSVLLHHPNVPRLQLHPPRTQLPSSRRT